MCISLKPARLSNTIIYAAEAQRDGKTFHVIGYQNKAHAAKGPNAMILPIPSSSPIGAANVVDTTTFKGILGDYDKAVERLKPRAQDRQANPKPWSLVRR